jgi:(1->4)-alpha-D-glucan 1-alpha-D-glucosylmutase
VRSRIGVLAGMADRFAEHAHRWHELNAHDGGPDWAEELLLYQTLVGAWPLELDRLQAYAVKALREAKRNTSWTAPDERWETQVAGFCERLYASRRFREDFEPVAAEVAAAGERSALGQLALRLTSPGVPDLYQGDELPLLALVDPDNRRPVDWTALRAALERGGVPKLELVRALLALRARRPDCFAEGYEPLPAGPDTCAFRRGDVVVAVPVRDAPPEVDFPGGAWRAVVDEAYAAVYERES